MSAFHSWTLMTMEKVLGWASVPAMSGKMYVTPEKLEELKRWLDSEIRIALEDERRANP